MLILLIETSTERGVVFIYQDSTLVFEEHLPPGLHNSTDLLPVVDRGLKKVGIRMQDIGLIGVGVGPGSYTGLRVGAMAAKTFSFVSKVPLAGICTLDCFASLEKQPFAVIIDAKIGGAYLKAEGQEAIVCPLDKLNEHLASDAHLVTPNSKMLLPKMGKLFPDNKWTWEEAPPLAEAMRAAALKKFKEGLCTTDGNIELLYMRKTQAEIEKGK